MLHNPSLLQSKHFSQAKLCCHLHCDTPFAVKAVFCGIQSNLLVSKLHSSVLVCLSRELTEIWIEARASDRTQRADNAAILLISRQAPRANTRKRLACSAVISKWRLQHVVFALSRVLQMLPRYALLKLHLIL